VVVVSLGGSRRRRGPAGAQAAGPGAGKPAARTAGLGGAPASSGPGSRHETPPAIGSDPAITDWQMQNRRTDSDRKLGRLNTTVDSGLGGARAHETLFGVFSSTFSIFRAPSERFGVPSIPSLLA
jgi:hypothetical protein